MLHHDDKEQEGTVNDNVNVDDGDGDGAPAGDREGELVQQL